ncbi:MAG: amidohydrolase family protein [Phycisphaerae bacterium]|jgi:cytosine deaminase
MDIKAIVNARRRDAVGLWSVRITQGRIVGIEPQDDTGPRPGVVAPAEILDADGGLVMPALIDAHQHLDMAYTHGRLPPEAAGTPSEALRYWFEMRDTMTAADVQQRAERAIRAEVDYGTGFLRSHVDVAPAAGMRLCEGVLAACEATRDICKVQLVALPGEGLVRNEQAVDGMRQALRSGVDLVGGLPHRERNEQDGRLHLERVFDLAAEFNASIDVHIDETDDASSTYTEQLAHMTIERGWQGRVTASHVCALSGYADAYAAQVIDLLAEARVHVVTCPGVSLYRQGRTDAYPKRRGLTRVCALLDAGVKCAASQGSINDPFYPLGTGQLLDQAHLLIHAEHMSAPPRLWQACDMICHMAGDVLGLACHRKDLGAPANLVVFPVPDLMELVRLRPKPLAVLHGGRRVAGTAGPPAGSAGG